MRPYLLVVPTRSIFADVANSYSLALRKTRLDHTDLIQLCLEHWELLSDTDRDKASLHALAEELMVQHYRYRLPTSFTDAQSVCYAIRNLLEAGHEFLNVWVEIAKLQFGFRQLQQIQAKTYLSSTSILLELNVT